MSPMTRRLTELFARLMSIAAEIEALHAQGADPAAFREAAALLYRHRRLRARFFDEVMFAEAAWDMLLDLAARDGDLPVTVTSLCLAAAVPPTTALRQLVDLERRGLVARLPNAADRRSHFVVLTVAGRDAMAGYFEALR